ncbi:MAG: transglutaminase-like domain-containing protein, partial [Candidatus Delongbacteria bacterium]
LIFSVLSELYRLVSAKIDFEKKDFDNISMISTILMIGHIIYYINSNKEIGVFSSMLEFLPVALFPLYIFYLYSTSKHINAKNLFLLFVMNKSSVVHPFLRKFRPDYIYFVSVLTAISVRSDINGFYFIFALLIPVFLKLRSKSHSLTFFSLSFTAVFLLSLFLQNMIFFSFSYARDIISEIYFDRFMKNREKSSSIGNIASSKNDFIIDLRADTFENKFVSGFLLRDRIYNSYNNGTWIETGAEKIDFESDISKLDSIPTDSMRIYFFSNGRKNTVKMPYGTSDFAGLETNKLRINSLGTAILSYTQYLVDYKTYMRKDSVVNLFGKPNKNDSGINIKDSIYTDPLIYELGLKDLNEDEIFIRLSSYFVKNYTYSLEYMDWPRSKFLENFIEIKKGHCELFATLTGLIYRRLGYSARYVTGYYISEYSDYENKYIGRRKDRHAWIMVWDKKDSLWKEYDTTPPDITAFRKRSTPFVKIYDWFSYTFHSIFMFRKENENYFENILLFSLIPLGLFLFYRILKDVKTKKPQKYSKQKNPYKKIEELRKIENKLRSQGFEPHNETVAKWFDRLKKDINDRSSLESIRKIYYRKRYGKYGTGKNESEKIDRCIKNISRKNNKETP